MKSKFNNDKSIEPQKSTGIIINAGTVNIVYIDANTINTDNNIAVILKFDNTTAGSVQQESKLKVLAKELLSKLISAGIKIIDVLIKIIPLVPLLFNLDVTKF